MKPPLIVETYNFDDQFSDSLTAYIENEIIPFMLEDENFKTFALNGSERIALEAVPYVFHKITPEVTFKVSMNQPLKTKFPALMKSASSKIRKFIARQEEQFPEITVYFQK